MTILVRFQNEDIDHFHTCDGFPDLLLLDSDKYNTITDINCSFNYLKSLPNKLPLSLKTLKCSNNELTSLPTLPDGLELLECNNCQLAELPTLPHTLKRLYCDNNLLTALPELPDGLMIIHCSSNQISHINSLPKLLLFFRCSDNKLTNLPHLATSLPSSLTELVYYNNPVYHFVQDHFNGNYLKYLNYRIFILKRNVRIIGNWFCNCKWNPEYVYCRKQAMATYYELYGTEDKRDGGPKADLKGRVED